MALKKGQRNESRFLEIDGSPVPLTVERRSGIKNISLRVTAQGVAIKVPRIVSNAEVDRLIENRRDWMTRHWRRLRDAAEAAARRTRENQVYYLGRLCRVLVCGESAPIPRGRQVQLEGDIFVVYLPAGESEWEPELQKWLREQAARTIKKRLAIISHKLHYRYQSVSIRDQKTRWGSCSSHRHLSFNWRLIMMPPEVLDYVIVHELCHLEELRHSPRFWSLVETAMPDYRQHRQWLRRNGAEYNKSTEV
ncbi:MAG: M48 family metallopeptidase [Firmicutes bacterium]|nr:M48 family metallopeptidase [Bacillota bacterium]